MAEPVRITEQPNLTVLDRVLGVKTVDGVDTFGDMPYNTLKSQVQADVELALADDIAAAAAGSLVFDTWAKLLANPGTKAGQGGRVTGPDAGTHTDPVVGGTKANIGSYSWSVAPAGWQWLAADEVVSLNSEMVAARGPFLNVDARFDAIESDVGLSGLTSQFVIGRPVPPVTGTSAASTTYVFGQPAPQDSYLSSVNLWALANGTVILRRFTRDAGTGTVTQSGPDVPLTVSGGAGLKTFTAANFGDVPVKAGEFIGYYQDGIVPFVTATGDSSGYYGAAGNLTTFVDTSLTTGLQLQIGINLAIGKVASVSVRVSDIESIGLESMVSGKQTVGVNYEPVTGSSASDATFVFSSAVAKDSVVTGVEVFVQSPGTVFIKRMRKSGITFAQVGPDYPLTVSAGLNLLTADKVGNIPFRAGEYVGVYSGVNLKFLVTGLTPFWSASGNANKFDDPSLTTDSSIQIRISFNQGNLVIAGQKARDEVEDSRFVSDTIIDANLATTGLSVTPSIVLDRDGSRFRITGSPIALTAPAATFARYDVIHYNSESGTFGVTVGTPRVLDPSAFVPVPSDSKAIPVFTCRVFNGEVEPIDTWRVKDNSDPRLASVLDAERRRSRRAISKFLDRLETGKTVKIVGFGDSITALQNEHPASPQIANGVERDRACQALATTAFNYLRAGYGADVVDPIPLYTAVQNGWVDDGAGQSHSRIGWNWELIRAIINRKGYSLTAAPQVKYDNFGRGSWSSVDAYTSFPTASAWLNGALASGAHLAIIAHGMNERGDTTSEARFIDMANKFKAAGMEVLFIDCPRPRFGSLSDWRLTNRAIKRAAIATNSAHVSLSQVYDDRYIHTLGIAAGDICVANANNHPGLEEFKAIGRELVSTVLDTDSASLSAALSPIASQELTFSLQRVGKQSTPATGTAIASQNVLIFPDPVAANGSTLVEVGLFAMAAGTVVPHIRSQPEGTNNFVKGPQGNSIAVATSGMKVYTPADFGVVTANKGEFFGIHFTAGLMAGPANVNGTPYWLVTGNNDATVVDATQARNFQFECYAIFENPQGLRTRVSANESSLAAARDETKMIIAPRQEVGYTGLAGTLPLTGSSFAQGHAAIVGAENFPRIIDLYSHTSLTETWAQFFFYTMSGSVVKIVRSFDPVKINVGLNQHTFMSGLLLEAGQMIGFSCHAAGSHIFNAGVPPTIYKGWLYATWTGLAGGKFTDATVDNSNILAYRLDWRRVKSSNESQMLFNERGVSATSGMLALPTQGDGQLVAGSIAFRLGLKEPMLMEELQWESSAISDVRWSFGVWNGTSYDIKQRLDAGPVSYEIGTNRLYKTIIIDPTWDLIGQGYTNGWIRKTAATTNTGWRFAALPGGGVYPDTFTPTSTNTTDRAEMRIVGKVLSGERHFINVQNSDKLMIFGPSYVAVSYCIERKNWPAYVGEYSDWRVEALGFSGETLNSISTRVLNGTFGSYPAVSFPNMGVTYAMLMEAYNSWDHPTANRTIAQYEDDANRMIEIVRSDGAEAIFVGEARRVYGEAGHALFRTIAENNGIDYIDVVQNTLRFDSGAKPNQLYQGVTGDGTGIAVDYHYGTRTGRMLADPIIDYMENNLPAYKQGMKAFRLRDTVTYTDADEVIPTNNKVRAKFWQELGINHISMTNATANHFDNLTGGTYAVTNVFGSEYLNWQLGNSLTFPTDGLLAYVLDAERRSVGGVRLKISDPTIQVFVKSARVTPYPTTVGVSACKWLEITGTAGVFELTAAQLAGAMDMDKISFRLFKAGGFTISEPEFSWVGKRGKLPRPRPTASKVNSLGVELLTKTTTETVTGWTVEGAATASAAAFQAPFGRTGFIEVNATKKIRQTIVAGTNNEKDRMVQITIECRRFPAVFNSANAFPSTSPITSQTWDDRFLAVEIIAPTGEVFKQIVVAGLWHKEVKCYATLPMRVGNHDIRVSGVDDPIEVYSVSVKEVTSTH